MIAIISILAAILFPVFATAREKARQTTCASNEKQLGLAFLQYAQDYDETFPVGGAYNDIIFPPFPWYGAAWAGSINAYVKSTSSFKCPDDDTSPLTRTVGGQSYLCSPVSYAYNMNIAWGPPYQQGILGALSKLDAPSVTVLLCEIGSNKSLGAYDVADLSSPLELGGGNDGTNYSYSPYSEGTYVSHGESQPSLWFATGYLGGTARSGFDTSANFSGPDGRHSGRANYLFTDGHVKSLVGGTVSSGLSYNATASPAVCISRPTDAQDQNCGNTAAGTSSTQQWTATFNPI